MVQVISRHPLSQAAFSIAPRSGSYASASGPPSPGPMTRSLNMNANPIASRSTAGTCAVLMRKP